MSTDYKDSFKNIEKLVANHDKFDVMRCLEDMDFEDTFPEDMCESRTDWEELKDRKEKAQRTVRVLLDIIDYFKNEMCMICMADASLVEGHTKDCVDCPYYNHFKEVD